MAAPELAARGGPKDMRPTMAMARGLCRIWEASGRSIVTETRASWDAMGLE